MQISKICPPPFSCRFGIAGTIIYTNIVYWQIYQSLPNRPAISAAEGVLTSITVNECNFPKRRRERNDLLTCRSLVADLLILL